jgi:hypothetical protein
MEKYNKIKYFDNYIDLPIIAFDKIDGSNLRFEYSHKQGFYKFGTRKLMIDRNSKPFGFAIDLFLDKYNDSLTKIFESKKYNKILSFVVYTELAGKKSSFGQHDFENDEFDITLIDIEQYKYGYVYPEIFIKDFEHTGIPKVIYEGKLTEDFIKKIKDNEFTLQEGVVCKGITQSKKVMINYITVK